MLFIFPLDINECEDPAIASRCVQNAECCNLPAHFICKCSRGFEGDGEEECRGTAFTSYYVFTTYFIARKNEFHIIMYN